MAYDIKSDSEYTRKLNLRKFKGSIYDKVEGSDKWGIEKLLNEYLKTKGKEIKESSLIRMAPVLGNYLDWCIEKEVNFYSPKTLNNYIELHVKHNRYSAVTLNKNVEIVLGFFNYCYGVGARDVKIMKKELVRLKETPNKKFVVREKHVAILLDPENLAKLKYEDVRDSIRHTIILLWHTGMRIGDAYMARWDWVKWPQQSLVFMPQKTSNFNKTIVTPMTDELVEYLKDRKMNHPDGKSEFLCSRAARIFSKPKRFGVNGEREYSRISVNDDPEFKVGLFSYMKEVLQPLYPDIQVNPRCFRYGAIQRLIEAGVNEKVIKEIYGWQTVNMISRYTNIKELTISEWKKAESNILEQAQSNQLA